MPVNKILIVEDDPNLLETLIYNLRKESYSVVAAAFYTALMGFRDRQLISARPDHNFKI